MTKNDIEAGMEWSESIYEAALKLHKPKKYRTINKVEFFALILELFSEIRHEEAIIQIEAVAVRFKFRTKGRTYWIFDMPEISDKRLYIEYILDQLDEFN
ncbi:hypothetical protein BS636_13095 [Acinetobacter sp. LoGeW2-3]|uniref:hypothetical protein n=1 Tax=Acinetobacter sp. LoGeW2-3 TaxID=1808001 RepID=UPI000C05B539|nr:hypothetical protein [Acinetobacter sp. LoGeW2-3]ATO20539.1 hypothetical protein BS636_13095 [Acinetobacter sp. LoGeW2-3]